MTSRVLLISPGIIKWTDMDFGLPHLVSIGGYLEAHTSVKAEIIDLSYEGCDHNGLIRIIDDLGPFIAMGISCYSSFDYMRVVTLAHFLKKKYPKTSLIVGGYHVSALPDDFIYDGSPFDAAVVGEGELPMKRIVESLLSNGIIEKGVYGPETITHLDELPPYKWALLNRYWPKALTLGRKIQIYLSRGCPHHCTFCMERSKGEYKWQPYTAERAIEELERLSHMTDLRQWLVNITDPLFGYKQSWRREVLESIIRKGLLSRHYWALTRAEGLEEEDVRLFAKARFAIGVGLESGSPRMLAAMQKTRQTEAYLNDFTRVAQLAGQHDMTFGANLIIGHPGETRESMAETLLFANAYVKSTPTIKGWLSFDPFRLYPGSLVHQSLSRYENEVGARIHHSSWWKSWYNTSFRAEHIDPSPDLDFESRVRFMYKNYGPLAQEIKKRFRGPGTSADNVFHNSIDSQCDLLRPAVGDHLIRQATRIKENETAAQIEQPRDLTVPIGLQVRNPWARKRESAVRKLLEQGLLKNERVIEALLRVKLEKLIPSEQADQVLMISSNKKEEPRPFGLGLYAVVLEGLAIDPGDRVLNLTPSQRYMTALLEGIVNKDGILTNSKEKDPTAYENRGDQFNALWIGLAVPRFPPPLFECLTIDGGRAATIVGPRFRPQDLCLITRIKKQVKERILAKVLAPYAVGRYGWTTR